jgi:type II secretory pathway pseudopilin PulG
VTLIEILAGVVILGTLLVSVAIARGRFLRQTAEADRRLAAIREADALLATWMSGPPQNVPVGKDGVLDPAHNLTFRTRAIGDPDAARLGAIVVRLEVLDQSISASNRASAPVFTVEFLLHDFRAPRPPQGAR